MFIRTQRLLLRPPWPEDVRELTQAIAHESVARMLSSLPWPYTEDDARWWVGQEQDPRLPSFVITLPSAGGMIVGGVGLHDEDGEAAVGYWVTPPMWGCGIASEALAGLVSQAWILGHSRLLGYHAADNPASGRVMRHAGFRPTGRIRSFPSLGRGCEVSGPELVLDLAQGEGDDDQAQAPSMPAAA